MPTDCAWMAMSDFGDLPCAQAWIGEQCDNGQPGSLGFSHMPVWSDLIGCTLRLLRPGQRRLRSAGLMRGSCVRPR